MPSTKKPNRPKGDFDPKKQARFDFEFAKQCLMRDGHVMPLFVVYTTTASIPVGWGGGQEYDDDARAGHRRMTGLVCLAYNAIAVAFIGEAWVAFSLPEDAADPEYPSVRVRDREDKREIIIAQLMWRDPATEENLSILAQAEIIRNQKGKAVAIASEEITEPYETVGGNFAAILPERPPTPVEQEAALKLLQYLQDRHAFIRTPSKPS